MKESTNQKPRVSLVYIICILALAVSGGFLLFFGDKNELNETFINNTNETANCSEQLEICVNEYNNLLYEFRNKTNCGGTTISMLKSLNKQLGEERDVCNQELEKANVYKTGFYMLIVLLSVSGLIIIIKAIRSE